MTDTDPVTVPDEAPELYAENIRLSRRVRELERRIICKINSHMHVVTVLGAEVARLRAREKDLTLEGLALIGKLEQVLEALAGTDIASLPADYSEVMMAQDRMAEIDRLRTLAAAVCWFDWSDADSDAVQAIDALRGALKDMEKQHDDRT